MSLCVQGRLPSSLDALKLRESCWLHLIVNDSFLTVIRSCNWAPKSLKIVAWKLLLNYVHFTIFVSRPRVQPRTPLDAVIATKREVDHIRGSSSPQRNTTINLCQKSCESNQHCRGSSAPTTPLLLHLLSLVVGAPPIFFFPYVLQITFHDAPNTTINNITAGNRTNLSIDNNVHSGG